jgi:hypothetical protein
MGLDILNEGSKNPGNFAAPKSRLYAKSAIPRVWNVITH